MTMARPTVTLLAMMLGVIACGTGLADARGTSNSLQEPSRPSHSNIARPHLLHRHAPGTPDPPQRTDLVRRRVLMWRIAMLNAPV